MKLGYIGYGEAAHSMASGFAEAGLTGQYAFSRTFSYSGKPEQAGVTRVASLEELCAVCSTIFVLTPNTAAVEMARKTAPFLKEGIVYVDLTSSNPKLMEEVEEIIRPTGALFVDGAMLNSLPKMRNKTKTVISGEGAPLLLERAAGWGMRLELVGERAGAASSIKMIQALYTKTLQGVAIEMLRGAAAYGVEDYVMHSMAESSDKRDFISSMDNRMSTVILHAARRAVELDMAGDMLDDAGLPSRVVRAAAEELRELGKLGLKEKVKDNPPETWKEALDVIIQYSEPSAKS